MRQRHPPGKEPTATKEGVIMEKKQRNFEDLPVWKESRELTREIYSVTKNKPFCYDRGLVDQITRASVSVMSNIAEGLERGTTNELIYFLFIAKGSAGEVRAQLYAAEDQDYITREKAERLRHIAKGISVQLSHWIKSLQRMSVSKGPQYNVEPEKETPFIKQMREWKKDFEQRLKNGTFYEKGKPSAGK
jgi:four helix bundle protein